MSSFFKKIAPIAGIASMLVPGIGTAIGTGLMGLTGTAATIAGNAALGAGLGAASGGGLKGATIGGLTGAMGGGLGSSLAKGAGLTGTAANVAGGALTGATGSALSGGDLGDVAMGAAVGGATPYVQQVGGEWIDSVSPSGTMQDGVPIPATKPVQTQTASLTTGDNPVNLGKLISAGSDIYGYVQGQKDLEDIEDMYQQAQLEAQSQLDPYAQAGQAALQNIQAPNMEALMNDPAYQFQLQQGNQALERSLAARGLGQSGAALKAAQQYGQGLANQTYQQYFDRQAQMARQGLNAAGGLGSIIGQGAGAQAAAMAAMINNRNQALSNIFRQDDDGILSGSLGRLLGGMV